MQEEHICRQNKSFITKTQIINHNILSTPEKTKVLGFWDHVGASSNYVMSWVLQIWGVNSQLDLGQSWVESSTLLQILLMGCLSLLQHLNPNSWVFVLSLTVDFQALVRIGPWMCVCNKPCSGSVNIQWES